MKPAPFAYHAATSVDDALEALARLGEDAKVLAGGQSLIPLMNMRLATPTALVDINPVAELTAIELERQTDPGAVIVGAGVRHAALERHDAVDRACPLLRQALRLVAHPVVRNRGTVCGSIAHADPAGELTAVLAVLGGTVRVERAGAAPRDIDAEQFFLGPLESMLEPADLVTSVRFPAMPANAGSAFVELARRHGDYALCGIAAVVELDTEGRISAARAGTIGVHPTPLAIDCSDVLAGSRPEPALLAAAANLIDRRSRPSADLHATVSYRRHLTRVLAARAFAQAAAHAARRSAVEVA
jgi:carbon-monoxide dehydrogenase medium subunit